MPGRPPQQTHSRARDTRRRRANDVTVSDDGQVRGLPLPDGYEWHPQTLVWWQTWRESPQAQTFTATDWSSLVDTAMLHTKMWAGDTRMAAEVRQRVAKYGATPEDRLRLKLAVGEPAPKAEPRPDTKQTRARRARLLEAVADVS